MTTPTLNDANGSGRVKIDGVDYYLGPIATAMPRFERLVKRWRWNDCSMPPLSEDGKVLTVSRMVRAFTLWAAKPVERKGQTRHRFTAKHLDNYDRALAPLLQHFGWLPAGLMTVEELKEVRGTWIDDDLRTSTINSRVGLIVRVFRWAVGEMMIPSSTYVGLTTLSALRPGEELLPAPRKVKPVAWADVNGILPHLPTPVAAMVRLQWLTGMRPGEVVLMRWADIDEGFGAVDGVRVWAFYPLTHKLSRIGKDRVIPLGPEAQRILVAHRKPDESSWLFSPSDVRKRLDWGDRYSTQSYGNAIRQVAKRLDLPKWSPNQLRHAAATAADEALGIEAAKQLLGHADSAMTENYVTRRNLQAMRYVAMHG